MIRLVIVFLIMAATASGQSITSVSGTVADGDTITISGSGFGSKSPVAPLLLERFNRDAGAVETTLDSTVFDYQWNCTGTGGLPDPARYSNSRVRGGSGLSARVITPDRGDGSGGADMFYFSGLDIRPGDYVYAQFFLNTQYNGARVDSSGCIPPDVACPQQYKPWRFSNDRIGYPAISIEWNGVQPLPPGKAGLFFKNIGPDTRSKYIMNRDSSGDVPDTSEWWSFEMEMLVNSAASVTDGWWETWILQESSGIVDNYSEASWYMFNASDPTDPIYDDFTFENYIQRGADWRTYHLWYDDVVCDVGSTALARVMLGDNVDFSLCTVREYLLATAWAAGEITVIGYVGGFAAESTAYLFVVDSTGSASAGYPVEIGAAGGGNSPPGQPTVSRVSTTATVSWTASSPAPTLCYQVEVIEASGLRHVRTVPASTLTCDVEVSASAQLRTKVYAVDADGTVQSESPQRVTAGS